MPGLKHQSIVQILRDEPQLLTIFLARDGFLLPSGGPFFGPELTMLHNLTGSLDLSIHEARMFALVTVAQAKPDRYRRYIHLIRIFTPRPAREELEQLMEDFF